MITKQATTLGLLVVVSAVIMYVRSRPFESEPADLGESSAHAIRRSLPAKEDIHIGSANSPDLKAGDIEQSTDIVIFSDGEQIPIYWRKRSKRPALPDFSLRAYDELSQVALNGDPYVPAILYDMVKACEYAPADDQALQDEIDWLQQTHQVRVNRNDHEVYVNTLSRVPEMIENMKKVYADCNSLAPEEKNNPERWLEVAVENGNSVAMVDLANQTEDAEQSLLLHQRAWQTGDPFGLYGMYEIGLKAYESGADPDGNVSAYAALMAFTLVTEQRFRATDTQSGLRSAMRFREDYDQKIKVLRPAELEQATAEAKELIRSNANCCLSFL